jgi:hypothetical protein
MTVSGSSLGVSLAQPPAGFFFAHDDGYLASILIHSVSVDAATIVQRGLPELFRVSKGSEPRRGAGRLAIFERLRRKLGISHAMPLGRPSSGHSPYYGRDVAQGTHIGRR